MAEPGNQTVLDGQRVEIPCETEGYPNKIVYTWFKDGQDIQTSNGYKVGRLKYVPHVLPPLPLNLVGVSRCNVC